jgi:hypothetical protein
VVVRARARDRIEIRLPEYAGVKLQRELAAFARYCIVRLERELGALGVWVVTLAPVFGGHTSHITVGTSGWMVEGSGTNHDATLAIWEAMCRVEQRARER